MKNIITKANKDRFKTITILMIIWTILSKIYPPIIIPSPVETFRSTAKIVMDVNFINQVIITLKRLFIGLFGAVFIGSIIGIFIGECRRMKNLFDPIFHVIQATPPISWLALGIIWFGLDGQATVFIVFISSIPVLIINIVEGFENIDPKLMEMAKIFKFSKKETLIQVILPSLKSYFKSGITIVVGLGWKLVIMGEVLSSSTGIGAEITNSRLNIATDEVLAWTIVTIILGVLSQKLLDITFDFKNRENRKYDSTDEGHREKIRKCCCTKRFFFKDKKKRTTLYHRSIGMRKINTSKSHIRSFKQD